MKHIIDTCGLQCPMPIIKTKASLETASIGDEIIILTDNPTAFENLKVFLGGLGINNYTVESECNISFILENAIPKTNNTEQITCNTSAAGQYVVVLKSDCMGQGDSELGRLLMRSYLNTLPNFDSKPSAIILYNSGVRLSTECYDTVKALQNLEENGVAILSCGTCLDFYGLKEKLRVGIITNMLKIAEITSKYHVVYP